MTETIEITVNGKLHRVPAGTTVGALLTDLDVARQRVAVERNGDIIPRATHDSVVLTPGDRLEVVTFVGGG